MSTDLNSQLANYGEYLRDQQEPIALYEISGRSTLISGDGSATDLELDPAIDVEIVITRPEKDDSMKPKPSTLLLLAAAAVIVIAGIFLAIESGSDDGAPVITDEVPEETTRTPQEIAAAFINAWTSGDADGVLATLTSDVALSEKYTGMSSSFEPLDRGFFEQHLAWSTAQGTTFVSPECLVTDDSSAAAVKMSCEFGWLYVAEKAAGAPPVPTTLALVVSAGAISELAFEYPPVFGVESFNNWLFLNHREDSQGVEFGDWNSVAEAQQGGTLRAQYVEEWSAELD